MKKNKVQFVAVPVFFILLALVFNATLFIREENIKIVLIFNYLLYFVVLTLGVYYNKSKIFVTAMAFVIAQLICSYDLKDVDNYVVQNIVIILLLLNVTLISLVREKGVFFLNR